MTVSKTLTVGVVETRYEADTVEELVALVAAFEKTEDNNDWITWNGGACPVQEGLRTIVKLRDGKISDCEACCYDWYHRGRSGDIVAYRVIK
jgi:hypothetical protein